MGEEKKAKAPLDIDALLTLAGNTKAETAVVRARAEATPKGPWWQEEAPDRDGFIATGTILAPPCAPECDPECVAEATDSRIADHIAASRTDVPAICDRADALADAVLELAAELDQMRRILEPTEEDMEAAKALVTEEQGWVSLTPFPGGETVDTFGDTPSVVPKRRDRDRVQHVEALTRIVATIIRRARAGDAEPGADR